MTIAVGAMEISAARNSVLRGLMKPLLLIGCDSSCSSAPARNIGASPGLEWDESYKQTGPTSVRVFQRCQLSAVPQRLSALRRRSITSMLQAAMRLQYFGNRD